MDPIEKAYELNIDGITKVPIFDSQMRKKILKEIKKIPLTFPEYKRDSRNPELTPEGNKIVYTLGGFGAFGNPSSFHHPKLREIREWVMAIILPVIKNYIELLHPKEYKKYKFSQLPDRFTLRRKGTSPSSEGWHRDVTPNQKKGDMILGGWLNFDENDSQYFSCIPGSQNEVKQYEIKPGFAVFPKKEHKELKARKKRIEIPPGYLMMFPQHLVHEVLANKAKKDSYRLYMGWRISKSSDPLFDIKNIMKTQGVPLLPSNQNPPVYSSNHGSIFVDKKFSVNPGSDLKQNLQEWSIDTFKEDCIEQKIRGSGKKRGERYFVVHRNMRSLETYGFKKYKDYSSEQIKIFLPKKSWKLKTIGEKKRERLGI